ncbi:MAG: FHA domain-containing protein [Nannocystis sp.]|nr:FHA domain-containing protein [Nannocystis sp.]
MLAEKNVSGQHAVLEWTGVVWQLQDLGSRNGTYVDNQRVGPEGRFALNAATSSASVVSPRRGSCGTSRRRWRWPATCRRASGRWPRADICLCRAWTPMNAPSTSCPTAPGRSSATARSRRSRTAPPY